MAGPEHLPIALDVLSDVILHPAFDAGDIEREKKVVLEEIKMVEDTPDDLVHELFMQQFWEGHPLGRPILGAPETVGALNQQVLRDHFCRTYTAPNLIVAAAGNLRHASIRDAVARAFSGVGVNGAPAADQAPPVLPRVLTRFKDLEQSHIVLRTSAYPQSHDDRYVSYVLNTVLGGSMSSRLLVSTAGHVVVRRGMATTA